jgi:serine/threonine protein kinase/phage FluMu protein Com
MISFACAHCGRKLKVPDGQSGKRAKCPHCHQLSPIPQPVAAAPAAESATLALEGTQPDITVEPTATIEVPGYEILGELGRGGMGVIYKARQLQPRRLTALKMILAGEYAGSDAVSRFQSEANAIARLSHPNIVRIHEVGEHQGRPYLTLEFIECGNLAERLRDKRLDFRAAAELLHPLARAIHFAHRAGIIHRDLKPANILLASDGTPKIADFGLAKQLEGTASVTAAGARTQSGAILGTPGYMAPEQAGGKRKDIGAAADVYSLGAILYECLTGQPPFQADTTIDTLLKVINEEPTPPCQLCLDCPRDLEIICLKCLQKAPRKRYASAGDLADDLRRFLDGEPIRARPSGKLQRLSRALRRRKELVYLAIGGAAALCLVALVLFFVPPSKPSAGGVGSREEDEPDLPNTLEASRQNVQTASRRAASENNLKQFALAMHNIQATYGSMSPAAITDKRTGKPLLSWRVAILPFIEQSALYRRFKLDEAWDGPNNSRLLPLMPKIFVVDGSKKAEPNATFYQVFVGPKTAFEPTGKPSGPFGFAGRRLPADFTDGTSNTLLVVEAAKAVPWTKPADLPYDPGEPLPTLGGHFPEGFNAAMADGSVRLIKNSVAQSTLRAAITRNGGEIRGKDWGTRRIP